MAAEKKRSAHTRSRNQNNEMPTEMPTEEELETISAAAEPRPRAFTHRASFHADSDAALAPALPLVALMARRGVATALGWLSVACSLGTFVLQGSHMTAGWANGSALRSLELVVLPIGLVILVSKSSSRCGVSCTPTVSSPL